MLEQAVDLIELRGDAKAAARVIEKNLRKSPELATLPVRTLLAEAYLFEAAGIAPQPAAANGRLIRDAKAALGGDLTPVARRAAARPPLAPVIPFLKGAVDPRQLDEYGATVLCSALVALNPAMVREELDNGADPNGTCNGESLVKSVIFKATNQHVAERQDILRWLLVRGARVEGLDSCASRDNGDCAQVLLPILQEFQDRRTKLRSSI